MSWFRLSLVLDFLLIGLSAASLAPAQLTPAASPESEDQKISRLEALLQAQQERIEALRLQASSSGTQDMDPARTDAMRQQIREILSEQEFRESLMPATLQAGYDDGFFIRSTDDKFKLVTRGYQQLRWTHYATRSNNRYLNLGLERDDRTGFDIQRLRLIFAGYAYDPNLTYEVQLRADAPDSYDVRVHWAYVNYRFADEIQFRAGIFKLASTRSQLQGEATFQFPDRPMVDAVYGLQNGLGVRFWGRLLNKRLDYYFDVANALGNSDNRTITPDPAEMDSNPAILFKAVWHALGDDPGREFLVESDLPMHKSPALDFGFHYAFNEDDGDRLTTRIPFPITRPLAGQGGFGLTTTNGSQINQFGLDASLKYLGFSAYSEYYVRLVDPRAAGGSTPFSSWWLLTGDGSTTAQHGAYVQVGYFLPIPGLENKVEAVARVGGISTLAERREGTWEYGAGLNYYIQGNRVKLQTDVTKISEVPITSSYQSLANVNDDALIFRVQLQVGF